MAGLDITKAELNKMIKDAVASEIGNANSNSAGNKKLMNKEQTKDMIRETLVELFKFLYQKAPMYVKQI